MLYLVIETSVILLAAAVIFFILGAYYQRHFATKAAEAEETTGSWNVANAKDDEKEWLRRRLVELEGQIATLANKRPPVSEPVIVDVAPALLEVESRLQVFVDERFEAIQTRLNDLHVTVTPSEVSAPVSSGPDAATLNAIAASERRLTQAMAAQFASLHHATLPAHASPISDDHLASVVERFAQELASVESRLTATMIDQLSDSAAHRDPAVDLRALAESFSRLEAEMASGAHLPKPKDTSADVRVLADAFGRLERHVAAMADAPVNVSVNLDEVNARFDRLEQTLATTGTPGQSTNAYWTDPGAVVPNAGNDPNSGSGNGPALWAPTANELEQSKEPTAMSESAAKELEAIAASVAALEAGTHARFDGLERQMAAAISSKSEESLGNAPIPTTRDLEVIAASVVALENGTHARFDGLERQMAAAMASNGEPTFTAMPPSTDANFEAMAARVEALESGTHARFDGLERQLEAALAAKAEPTVESRPLSTDKNLEVVASKVEALETGTHARFDGLERQLAAALAAKAEPTLETTPSSTDKNLEVIAAKVEALETGTHSRFDGLERQIVAAAKPAQMSRVNGDDRLERIERRLEEMSVRAEQSANAFQQIATSDSMDQLGEEMRDNAATLERRTVALEVELVRHRELLKKVSETPVAAVAAPVVDPANDPAVVALETAKQDLAQRIDAIRETIDRHVAAATEEIPHDDHPHVAALEQKLDSIAYRIDQSAHGRSDATPMIEALRMDLAGLRVAMLQSVAANRSPISELHGIRTELERLRGSMDTVGKENHQHTAREAELAMRLSELERRGTDREREFEDRERRLDDEYQQRVVALERELESMERKLEREEREEAQVSGHDERTARLEERERRLEERESAMSERISVLERELAEAPSVDPEMIALRERLAAAEAQLARASEERHEEEIRRDLERRMDERLAETQRDSRELRDELRDISTILRDAPEPPPVIAAPVVAPVVPVVPMDSVGSKEVLARIDRLEDLLWETTAEVRRGSATKKDGDNSELARITAKLEVALAESAKTADRNLEGLHTAIMALRESFAVTLDRRAEQLEGDMEQRFTAFRTMLESDSTRRDAAGNATWERARETFTERLEQLRSQLALQLERQAADVKDAERALADRFDLKLERSLEGVSDALHRELAPRFETLQMALRFGGPVTHVGAMPETDSRALSRLEDRLRDIEGALHDRGPSGGSDEARAALERERRMVAEELREAERRSRDKIRKLERELEAARTTPAPAPVTETNSYREEDMPRGRYGMGGGFIDPSRILEELDHRLSEAEERFEKLSKEGANVAALEAQLKTEREAREDLEDRLRDLEHRDRERQSSIEAALERTRNDQGRTTLELRSEMRRELDDRLRDAEDRMARRAAPMMPPAQPMMGYGMPGPDAFAMNALHDMDRRLREAMDSMRVREGAMTAAMEELRASGSRDNSEQFETALQEAVESLEQRMDAMREDSQLSEPINAALRAFRERLESLEKVVDEQVAIDMAPALEKIEDRIRELESKEREQASGMYADIDDLRRTLNTERRTMEERLEARLRDVATSGGGNSEETEKIKKEISESNDRTQKQLLAMRDYVVRLDKAIKPLEERIGSFESQLGARVDGPVSTEMVELLGERLTRLEIAPKPATVEHVEAITSEVGSAIDGLRTVFSNALTRLDGVEQRVNGATVQISEALTAIKAHSEDRIEDLVAHIDHLQEEMREEAMERDSTGGIGGVEPTELHRVEEEDMKRFREVQERFERLEKSFGAKFDSVKHDLEENIHHSEERAHDDALSLTSRSDERLEKMVGGLEKLVAEKENIIAELSDRVKSLTEQVHQNPDDLTDIAGIGPKLRKRLKEEFGITTFKSLATISSSDLERLAGMLLFPDRIFREDWIGQARELHLRKYNELLSPNEAEGEMRMRLAS